MFDMLLLCYVTLIVLLWCFSHDRILSAFDRHPRYTSAAFHSAFVAFQDIRKKGYIGCEMHHQRVSFL